MHTTTLSPAQAVAWLVTLLLIVFFTFVWVPYHMRDGTVKFGWRWSPPLVVDPVQDKVFSRILEEEELDAAMRELVEASRYRPATVSRSLRRMILLLLVGGGLVAHTLLRLWEEDLL